MKVFQSIILIVAFITMLAPASAFASGRSKLFGVSSGSKNIYGFKGNKGSKNIYGFRNTSTTKNLYGVKRGSGARGLYGVKKTSGRSAAFYGFKR